MTLAVGLFGLCVVGLGVGGALAPERLLGMVTRVQARLGLRFIAALRLARGRARWLAAPGARAPLYLQALAVLSLVSGAVTPFFGAHRFEAVLAWWRRRPPAFVRVWSLFVAAFGASLVWAVTFLGGAG
jgi:hypothetical protein